MKTTFNTGEEETGEEASAIPGPEFITETPPEKPTQT
jgi:hypothetical protein